MSCWFRQCLELLNTLIAERSSEARRFGRSSNHLFRSQYFGKYWNYETHIFLSKCSKFNVGLIKAIKIAQKIFCFWDNAVWSCCCKFIIFRREYLSSAANVLKTVLNFQFWLRQAFSNSIYRILMKKSDNSGSVLISAGFETREDLD